MGHEVIETRRAFDYDDYLHAMCVIWGSSFEKRINAAASEMRREISEETLEPVTLSLYRYSRALTIADLLMVNETFNKLRRTFANFFEGYDVLLTPTIAQLPEPLGKYALRRSDLDWVGFMRQDGETSMYLYLANITGRPAISLPLGQSKSRLPIGVQFVARFGDEGTLIRLASAFEKTMPWNDRIPPVHVSR
jgi:amidase